MQLLWLYLVGVNTVTAFIWESDEKDADDHDWSQSSEEISIKFDTGLIQSDQLKLIRLN